MTTRPARPDDADAIGAVHVRTWQVAYEGLVPAPVLGALSVEGSARLWRARLPAQPPAACLVAVDDVGTVTGFCSVGPHREDPSPATGEVLALYVSPGAWGTGAGAALLAAGERALAAAGLDRARLWVLATNDRARGFYAHHGWRADGSTKDDARDGVPLPEVGYAKALTR